MRNKLALISALASFGLVTALGVGFAGADEVTTEAAETLPPASAPLVQAPACSNEIDDDGDGLVDGEDPGCESLVDESEQGETAEAPSSPPSADDPGATNNSSIEAPQAMGAPVEKHGGVKAGTTIGSEGGG